MGRHMNQCNGIESGEINPYISGQLNFDKGAKYIKLGNNNLFSC